MSSPTQTVRCKNVWCRPQQKSCHITQSFPLIVNHHHQSFSLAFFFKMDNSRGSCSSDNKRFDCKTWLEFLEMSAFVTNAPAVHPQVGASPPMSLVLNDHEVLNVMGKRNEEEPLSGIPIPCSTEPHMQQGSMWSSHPLSCHSPIMWCCTDMPTQG